MQIMRHIEKEYEAMTNIIKIGKSDNENNELYSLFINRKKDVAFTLRQQFDAYCQNVYQQANDDKQIPTAPTYSLAKLPIVIISFLWIGQNCSTSINLMRLEYAILMEKLCANLLRNTVEEKLMTNSVTFPKKLIYQLMENVRGYVDIVDRLEKAIWPDFNWISQSHGIGTLAYNYQGRDEKVTFMPLHCQPLTCKFANMIIQNAPRLPTYFEKSINTLEFMLEQRPTYPKPYMDPANPEWKAKCKTNEDVWMHVIKNRMQKNKISNLLLQPEEMKIDN